MVVSTSALGDLDEIVVNGIRRGDLILPTTVTSDFGLRAGPRRHGHAAQQHLLSKAQLDALNVQNPGGFSYLTSSSYSDASFGEPNMPRIRGQYADMFFNGMRDSFTLNGYGAPISFNSVDSIDIVKGPASVQAGPGAGVGGAIDITTKMPSFVEARARFNLEFDTQQKRRASFDVGGPLTSNMAARVSFTERRQRQLLLRHVFPPAVAVCRRARPGHAAVLACWSPAASRTPRYRENDGINRVNQQLIDNGTYLTGGVVGGPCEHSRASGRRST